MKSTLLFFTFLFVFSLGHVELKAQSNEDKALAKGQEAIRLVDEGKYAEGIKRLEEAQKLDSKNTTYPYEMAHAYYSQKDYRKAIKYLEPLVKQKTAKENVYQLIGNSYDLLNEKGKALTTYDDGLKEFPNSGSLHLEKGNMALFKEDYNSALAYYEKGIEVDPQFASNYYWAARIYCSSTEKVWGVLYGEIFINLERNSKRSGEISKLLYDTYKGAIKFTSDTSISVSFSKQATMDISNLQKGGEMKMPYGTFVYEMTMTMAILHEKKIDLVSLNRIRSNFVDVYYKNGNDTKYANVLFDYQQQLKKAGYFEVYNYWLLGKGEEAVFSTWRIENKAKWEEFVAWFNEHKLTLNEKHKFYRKQY
ncbi:MAG: tetratricopeptide repeat protein [Cytophagaceae bacterium]|nr:tetratricopeptide repeat protein [Cytophagaceae bacterium]